MYVKVEHYNTEDQESPNIFKDNQLHRIAISISLLHYMNSEFIVLQIYL